MEWSVATAWTPSKAKLASDELKLNFGFDSIYEQNFPTRYKETA